MEYLNLSIYNRGQLSGPTCKSQHLSMILMLNKKYVQDFIIKLVGDKTKYIYCLL